MVNKKKSRGKSQQDQSLSLPLFSVDDCQESIPAAGYRNGTKLNNAGENGNCWSSTPNESNTNNAYNLNFNSGNFNRDWNNRNNGQSVRPVSELTSTQDCGIPRFFSLSRQQLLLDLIRAYKDARKNKRGKAYQLKFEFNLEDNLSALCHELFNRTYTPEPSTCFIIHDPKMREVFAASFRDRIVHHLFYNYAYEMFERTFIADSYSCLKNRGAHYGIDRLKHHIRSVSQGHSKPCYVMKIDIRGYFMHINRDTLLSLCRNTLEKMRFRKSSNSKRYCECVDFDFLHYLLACIISTDPTKNCRILGHKVDWEDLPAEKSIFCSSPGNGLPIGNLSSQLFSNVYLNHLDQFMKRILKCRHYGRYVDDAYIVACSRGELKKLVPKIDAFLRNELKLELNSKKTQIFNARHGVEFIGAFIKPFRTYPSSSSLRRMMKKTHGLRLRSEDIQPVVNSYLGMMSHYNCYKLRRVLFGHKLQLGERGNFSRDWLKFTPFGK